MTRPLRTPIRRWLVAIALAVAWATPAATQELTFGALVESQFIAYLAPSRRFDPLGRAELRFRPRLRLGIAAWGDLRIELDTRADAARRDRDRTNLREAHLELARGSIEVRLGRMFGTWGRADALAPANPWDARDYSDPLDAAEEPVPEDGVQLTWFGAAVSVEAVVVPRFRGSLLPGLDSRWWPDLPSIATVPLDQAGNTVVLATRYTMGPASWPQGGQGRTAAGVRVTGSSGGWDLAVSAFDGPIDLPAYLPVARPDVEREVVEIRFDRLFYRIRSLGADFATVVGPVGLHGEAAWLVPYDEPRLASDQRRSWIHWVVGGDLRRGGIWNGHDLFALVEWSREMWPSGAWEPFVFDLTHAFRNTLFARLELERPGFSAIRLEAAIDAAGGGWFGRIRREWVLGSGMRLDLAIDWPGGATDSYFGAFVRNRRGHVRFIYTL